MGGAVNYRHADGQLESPKMREMGCRERGKQKEKEKERDRGGEGKLFGRVEVAKWGDLFGERWKSRGNGGVVIHCTVPCATLGWQAVGMRLDYSICSNLTRLLDSPSDQQEHLILNSGVQSLISFSS